MTVALMRPSTMTEREFGVIFASLAMQLRWHDADVATIKSYFDVLKDVPLDDVKDAAALFARESGRKFPPTSAEWFTSARAVEQDRIRKVVALPPGREEPWHHECGSCEDTGWVIPIQCDGGAAEWPEARGKERRGSQHLVGNRRLVGYRAEERLSEKPRAAICGKERPHAPHEFTRACGCRATNRTYQRHQAR